MKNLCFFFISIFLFVSCSKDDNCEATSLESTIVGKWDVRALGSTTGQIEFKADGTLIDPDDALLGGEVNGMVLDQKSYTVISDTQFSARAENGSNFIEYDFDVIDYSCDKITIDFIVEIDLVRN